VQTARISIQSKANFADEFRAFSIELAGGNGYTLIDENRLFSAVN
jgi:hypothetical protein